MNNSSGTHRALQISRTGGYPGTVLLFHPINNPISFQEFDNNFREACCEIGNITVYCDLFFNQRITDTGENYVPPKLKLGKYVW